MTISKWTYLKREVKLKWRQCCNQAVIQTVLTYDPRKRYLDCLGDTIVLYMMVEKNSELSLSTMLMLYFIIFLFPL